MKKIIDMRNLDQPSTPPQEAATAEHLDALLEEALMETFPASDPISFSTFRDH